MSSWLFTDTAPAALLDELVKIGEDAEKTESNKDRVLKALGTIGIAAAGGALGHGAGIALRRYYPPPTKGVLRTVQIGLPILGGIGVALGGRYQKEIREGLFGKESKDGS
jgi:hypothetical protein